MITTWTCCGEILQAYSYSGWVCFQWKKLCHFCCPSQWVSSLRKYKEIKCFSRNKVFPFRIDSFLQGFFFQESQWDVTKVSPPLKMVENMEVYPCTLFLLVTGITGIYPVRVQSRLQQRTVLNILIIFFFRENKT